VISRKSNDTSKTTGRQAPANAASRQAPSNDGGRQALIAGIGAATQAFQRSTDAFDDLVAQRMRLNRTDLRCLDWLFDGPKTAGDLAVATGLSSAATTTMLDRLERRGLVRRVRDQVDRRKVLVEMTEQGRRESGAYYAPLAQEGARLLEQFTEEQLTAMRDHLLAATDLIDRHRARLRGSH
jgi:DNA-binding MarR family transcriptional regulator